MEERREEKERKERRKKESRKNVTIMETNHKRIEWEREAEIKYRRGIKIYK